MRLMRPVAIAIAAALPMLSACEEDRPVPAPPAAAEERAAPAAKGFDFFVLALSWSPSYCASEGEHANRQQCGAKERYGFVVHGLWPQFAKGYPIDCPTERPLSVPRTLADTLTDIMPSTGLIRHEWATHGTCSGVSQEDYFTLTRMAFEAIAIPDEFAARNTIGAVDPDNVEDAFRNANPGMHGDAIAVTCDRRYLRDVRICMTRDLTGFISCPEVDGDACSKASAVMPPVR
ncbi:MAG: ribonuclease [Oricola sp.]